MKTRSFNYLSMALYCVMSLLASTLVHANNLPPVAVINLTPDKAVYYAGETIALYGGNSYVQSSGNINYYQWYINGELKLQGSGATSYNHTVIMETGSTEQTLTIRLRVRHSNHQWDSKTITRTEKQKPGQHYYLTDHLGSVRATVNAAGTLIGWDDYYPFGMVMPGRSFNSANPNDLYKFTGHERDREAGLEIDFMNARTYDSEIGRFLQRDPLAHMYPGVSPYVYALNNPLIFIDPDGREVRCASEEDCERAAQELNEIHGNETDITVVEAEWEETVASEYRFLRFLGLGKTKRTVSGFKLSTQDSSFDFGQHEITSALYDVINSDEFNFYFEFVSGETVITRWPTHATAFQAQGRIYPRPGGGGVRVSADGNEMNVPTGVVIMHELVGHGHPNSIEANDVNRYYGAPTGRRDHGGYHDIIGWPKSKTGLYRKRR